ncbi:hypothetical protein PC116_g20124 [Phytophthora cactorum]|uniref:Uncharacterized protein n=1 Tax=Phytophthora cactorum TaxID=29920 RepID=A0A8T1B152_9STRA|nr:hypothetical protein PC117_g24331 [Phytophthora cactorum]KAG3171368.1 hypothetical protein PC128_g18740 [Phytophthora cactorum]KAG4231617.1 hypothetical protein PC116_g20124 [Phytophthora cactorum]
MAVTDRQLTKSKLRDSDSAKPYFEKKAHCLQGAVTVKGRLIRELKPDFK